MEGRKIELHHWDTILSTKQEMTPQFIHWYALANVSGITGKITVPFWRGETSTWRDESAFWPEHGGTINNLRQQIVAGDAWK